MILGRSPNLFLGAITAILNMLVVLGVFVLTPEQVGAINVAAGALIALVAGSDTLAIRAGTAAQDRKPPK